MIGYKATIHISIGFSATSNTSPALPRIKRKFIDLELVKWVSLPDAESIMLYCISFQTPNYYWSLYDWRALLKALKKEMWNSAQHSLIPPATTCYLKDRRALVQRAVWWQVNRNRFACFTACFSTHSLINSDAMKFLEGSVEMFRL